MTLEGRVVSLSHKRLAGVLAWWVPGCRDFVVTLDGLVRTEEERRRAEDDAWCLFAVDDVVNRIEVRR